MARVIFANISTPWLQRTGNIASHQFREEAIDSAVKMVISKLERLPIFRRAERTTGAILIINLPDPSKVLAFAEPWFLAFNANVEFQFVMTPDDPPLPGNSS
jgi:hypothetical protein